MNTTTESNVIDIFEKTKQKLDNWDLLKLPKEEQVKWFKDNVVKAVADAIMQRDPVDEIIVVSELYDVAIESLNSATLPEDFPPQEGVTMEKLNEDFAEYCSTIVVKESTSDKLAMEDAENHPPEILFIRLHTQSMKLRGFIENWDRSINFSALLRQMGCPIEFSYPEKKILFGMFHMLNIILASSNRPPQGGPPVSSNPGAANMFNMD